MMGFIYNVFTRSLFVLLVAMLSVNYLPDHLFQDFSFEPKSLSPIDFDSVKPEWNNKLSATENKPEFIHLNQILGPESIAFSPDGLMYTSLADGRLVELDPKRGYKLRNVLRFNPRCPDNIATRVAECGRFLQIRFVNNSLYAMESNTGLYKVDVKTGAKTHLGPKLGDKVKLFNSFAFDPEDSNIVYFTISSMKWDLLNIVWTIVELDDSGKLMVLDIKTGKYATVYNDLMTANGIDVDVPRDQLILSETTRSQVSAIKLSSIRQAFKSAKNGDKLTGITKKALIPIVPGNPDNIVIDGDKAYIALPFVKQNGKELVDHLFDKPSIRKTIARFLFGLGRLLEFVHANAYQHPLLEETYKELKCGHMIYRLFSTDKSGVIEYNLATGASRFLGSDTYGFVSEAMPHQGHLYLGSFRSPFMVKVKHP